MHTFEFLINNLTLNMNLMAELNIHLVLTGTNLHESLRVFFNTPKGKNSVTKEKNIGIIFNFYLRFETFKTIIN